MTAKRWYSVPYSSVVFIAMKLYKEKFLKHDIRRFINYLVDVKSGKEKVITLRLMRGVPMEFSEPLVLLGHSVQILSFILLEAMIFNPRSTLLGTWSGG
ncbi:hypothetical protein HN51_053689 [Arachis hypogaea]